MFRSFSGTRGPRGSARAGRHPRAPSSQRPASRLRLESLEDRRLLAITPIGEFDVVTGSVVSALDIANNAAGDFVVLWSASGADGDGDGLGILAQTFNADGVAQSGRIAVNTTTAGDQRNPSVAIDADGDFVVAWESGEIMAQRFDRTGAKVGGEITVNTYTDLTQAGPSVGSDGAGNFTVVWKSGGGADPTGTGHNGGIFGRQFAPDGSALGGEFRVDNPFPAGQKQNPKIAMNASGEFAVAWMPQGSSEIVPLQWFHGDGTRNGGLATIDLSRPIGTNFPFLLDMDATGNVFIFGTDTSLGSNLGRFVSVSGVGQTPVESRIYFSESLAMDSAGNFVWGPEYVGGLHYETNTLTTFTPIGPFVPRAHVAFDDSGRVTVVNSVMPTPGHWVIHVQRFVIEVPIKVTSVTTFDGEFLVPTLTDTASSAPSLRDPSPARRPLNELIASFSGAVSTIDGPIGFHSVTNPENWQLFKDGIDISSEIGQIKYADNRATISLHHTLPAGHYRLVALDSIQGVGGEALDGDADGVAGDNYSTEFEVSSLILEGAETIVGFGSSAKAASNPDGSFIFAWTTPGSGSAVRAQRYDALGMPIGSIIEVGATNNPLLLDIESDSQGRWVILRRTTAGLVVRRYDANGQPLGGDEVVADATASSASLGVDAAGNYAVVWRDSSGVKLQKFDALGETIEDQVVVDSDPAFENVGVAVNDAGAMAVSWQSGTSQLQRVRAYSADGIPTSGVIEINPSQGSVNRVTPILIDEEGSFVVSWLTSRTAARAQRFNASGLPLSGEISIGADAQGIALALDPQGGLLATWLDPNPFRSAYERDPAIYAQRILFTGEAIGKPIRVTSTADPSSVDVTDTGLVVFGSIPISDSLARVGFQRITATPPAAAVVDRRVFYNQSAFDSDDPGSGPEDDGAIAPDKVALLPGQSASLANYTSYWLGINGVMIDLAGMHGNLSLDDFSLRRGNSNDPSSWIDAPLPSQITVRAGAGVSGSDRIELIWGNGVKNQWLEVTLLANADTGLDVPDVFYFGNAVGESGNSATDARVNTSDQLGPRNNATSNAAITNRFDYNRDGHVDTTDELLARNNPSGAGNALKLIDLGEAILVTAASAGVGPVTGPSTNAAGPIASALALSTITTLDSAVQPAPAWRDAVHVEPAVARSTALAARIDAALAPIVQDRAKAGDTAESFVAFLPDDDWLQWAAVS